MDSALDEVEFLVRSEHRVEALGALVEREVTVRRVHCATTLLCTDCNDCSLWVELTGWVNCSR